MLMVILILLALERSVQACRKAGLSKGATMARILIAAFIAALSLSSAYQVYVQARGELRMAQAAETSQ